MILFSPGKYGILVSDGEMVELTWIFMSSGEYRLMSGCLFARVMDQVTIRTLQRQRVLSLTR